MTEQIQRKLSESEQAKMGRTGARRIHNALRILHHGHEAQWLRYEDLLQTPVEGDGLRWTANECSIKFTSTYRIWFNVFFLMLIFGGMILDKMGVRFTGLLATSIHAYRRFHQMVRYITQL